MKIAGISRKEMYSPNHITNDALILIKTANALRRLGHEVNIYDESFIEKTDVTEEFIVTMAQGIKGIKRIQEFETKGANVINTPSSSLNTYRIQMTKLLQKAGIPYPATLIVDSSHLSYNYFDVFKTNKVWLKRGDVHAEHKEDVSLVYSKEELETTVREFHKRGINSAVIQEHVTGTVIKYYGIRDTDFFHWYYLNGNGISGFSPYELKEIAFKSADVLGLDIFGGDVVIDTRGGITVIDVNDWPSFAPVRDAAAENIAQLVHNKILKHVYHY